MKKYETWSVGNGEINLYTENQLVAKVFKQLFKRLTTYERNGKVFAWQCCMPVEKLGFVEMQIKKYNDIENQQVTGADKGEFRFKDMNPVRAIHSHPSKRLYTIKRDMG